MKNSKYRYSGPVMQFGKCISQHIVMETSASSFAKARCNFEYRYKRSHGMTSAATVELPGDITKIG